MNDSEHLRARVRSAWRNSSSPREIYMAYFSRPVQEPGGTIDQARVTTRWGEIPQAGVTSSITFMTILTGIDRPSPSRLDIWTCF